MRSKESSALAGGGEGPLTAGALGPSAGVGDPSRADTF